MASNQHIDVLYDASKQESNALLKHLGTAGYQTRIMD